MDIRGGIFAIFLITSVFRGRVFSSEKDLNESEYLAMLRAEGTFKILPLTPKDDQWGEPNNGFVMQLIPRSEEFVVGKPMIFGLVMKNVSDSVKQYVHQPFPMDPVLILDANNNEVYYKRGVFQTQAPPTSSIESGEVVTLFENLNITEDYVITEPGKYTIRYRGPSFNVVEFEVRPGTPDDRDLLIASLFDILPDANWSMLTGPRNHVPAGRKDAQGNAIALYRVRSRIRVVLWLTKIPAQVDEHSEDPQTSDYLGKNALGYFYITIPPKALDYWPNIKEDIAKALEIDSPSGQNP